MEQASVWGLSSWLCPKFCPDMMRDGVKPVLKDAGHGQVVSSDMARPVEVNRNPQVTRVQGTDLKM